ncbi:MAG: beta/gamma crystallin family protein [Thermoanaerobaculia bacterium]|nr:beta/gamma crystallin family protein [Thermoanaerobaculia bacterium]
MRNRSLVSVLIAVVVSWALASASLAQVIVLYQDDDFRGSNRVIDGPISSLDSIGWNDKASSLRVTSGAWEVCKDDRYRGCEILFNRGQGEIRRLSAIGWNDRISSLRPVDGNYGGPGNRPGRPDHGYPSQQNPESFSIDGRGVMALDGQADIWFNKAQLSLGANGSFALILRTNRSEVLRGTYRWNGRDQIDLQVTQGPGDGRGTAYLERGRLHSVEIMGSSRGRSTYAVSFINYEFAPWN